MKQRWIADLTFYIAAPLVVGLVLFAFWLTVMSSYENYRLGSLADQVIRIVELSRELRISKEDTPQRAQDTFIDRIRRYGQDNVVMLPADGIGQSASRGMENPWGDPIRIVFYPSYHALRIESPLSASICRRLISLYKKDVSDLGVQRVDVRSSGGVVLWRKIYEARDGGQAVIPEAAIYSGCGISGDVVVSLTFSL